MPPGPELVELRHRLQEIGMVVVEAPDHLSVRLPYFCSVRIYLVAGCLRFEPFFGVVPRTRSTMGKMLIFISFTAAALRAGVPYALGVGIIGIMLGIYDVVRTIATENVISRAGVVYAQLVHGDRARPAFGASKATRVLEPGSVPASRPFSSAPLDEQGVRNDR